MKALWRKLRWVLLLLGCLEGGSSYAFGAGLTIIVHGLQLTGGGFQLWEDSTAKGIAARTSTGTAAIYRLTITSPSGTPTLCPISGNILTEASGEVIIEVDWSALAGPFQQTSTATIGKLVADVIQSNSQFAQLPVHLIGHSRGASVISEIAKNLAMNNIWVEQITFLDPEDLCEDLSQARDPPFCVYDNVYFSDDYYDPFDGIGQMANGAYNESLPLSLNDYGYALSPLSYSSDPLALLNPLIDLLYDWNTIAEVHSNVHFWYFGTIEPSDSVPYDTIPLYMSMNIRDAWYDSDDNDGSTTGFYYSRIAGGYRPAQGVNAYFQGLGGSAVGSPVHRPTDSTAWPNIMVFNTSNSYLCAPGQPVQLTYYYSDTGSNCSLQFMLDDDQNPNNNQTFQVINQTPIPLDQTDPSGAPVKGATPFTWTPDPSQNNMYVVAKITDLTNGNFRYYYLPDPLIVSQTPTPEPTAPATANSLSVNPTLRWAGGNGNGVPEATEQMALNIQVANPTSGTIRDVQGFLSTNDLTVSIAVNQAYYGDLQAGYSSWGSQYNMTLGNFTDTHTATFNLRLTYLQGNNEYYQDYSFQATLYPQGVLAPIFQVVNVTATDPIGIGENNGDGIIQSGEKPVIQITLTNTGNGNATGISAVVTNCTLTNWLSFEQFPNMPANSGETQPLADGTFSAESAIPESFSGPVYGDVEITCDQSSAPFVIHNVLLFNVQPAAWLYVDPAQSNLGELPTASNPSFPVTIYNDGSQTMTVSAITSSDPTNLTWSGPSLPWSIDPGQIQVITASLATTNLQGTVNDTLSVTSDARFDATYEENELQFQAFVGDAQPVNRIALPASPTGTPDISGNYIVWSDSRNGAPNVYSYNVKTGLQAPVSAYPAAQYNPHVSGNLIVWEDLRNSPSASGPSENRDIYGFDLSANTEFVISTNPADEALVGVDGTKVAFLRSYGNINSYNSNFELFNLWIYDYSTGQSTQVTNFTSNQSIITSNARLRGGVLYWQQVTYSLETTNVGTTYWNIANSNLQQIVLANGFSQQNISNIPVLVQNQDAYGNLVAWSASENNPSVGSYDQVSLWSNGGASQVTSSGNAYDSGRNVVAVSSSYLIYDTNANGAEELDYYDLNSNDQRFLSPTGDPTGLSMDGAEAVWLDNDDPNALFYTSIGASDLSLTSDDLELLTDNPVNGGQASLNAQVENLSTVPIPGPISVALYQGNPLQGGIQIGDTQSLPDGISANNYADVLFTIPVLPLPGSYNYYVQATAPASADDVTGTALAAITINVADNPANPVAVFITGQPSNESVIEGEGANFSVSASGTSALAYQWQRLPAGSSTWSNLTDTGAYYTGSATPMLTISPSSISMSGDQFQCLVTDSGGSVTSNIATLTVTVPTLPTGLVGWWKFDEGTGSTTADSSGIGNNGTLAFYASANLPTWVSGFMSPYALNFDGQGSYVDVKDAPSLDQANTITLAAWVNPDPNTTTGNRRIIEKGSQQQYCLRWEPAAYNADTQTLTGQFVFGLYFTSSPNTVETGLTTPTISLNSWTHVAATYDGSQMCIYVNGTLVASQAASGTIGSSGNDLNFGMKPPPIQTPTVDGFAGAIDDVKIYNNALSADQIQIIAQTPPAIATQPTNQTVFAGSATNFTVTMSGTPTPTIQWQVSTDGGTTWTNLVESPTYSGVTSATLTITNPATTLLGYQYRAVITNYVATISSKEVPLVVGTSNAQLTWLQNNFTSAQLGNPAIVGDTAEPAGDGIPNLLKYAFNLPALVNEQSSLPQPTVSNGHLVLTYPALQSDLTYTAEVSPDLVNWSTTGVTQHTNGTQTTASYPIPPTGPAFLRIVVAPAP